MWQFKTWSQCLKNKPQKLTQDKRGKQNRASQPLKERMTYILNAPPLLSDLLFVIGET